jgi:hypothetical protein
MSRLARFRKVSWSGHKLLLEATVGLCWYKATLYLLPFRWIAPHLGRPMTEPSSTISGEQREVAKKVAWAVRVAGNKLPWHNRCLVRAVTAKGMLRRRGLGSTLYLGVRRGIDREVSTHAWLRVGELPLVGARGARDYTVLATFADD